ncbi:hypothetical protein SAMN05428969_2380 [Devosia sp. YR412]|uniref:hypothetical protein n=1 Tax=Devosia sp. YR412 TaxID=1881030 RepID=UPI0008BF8D27|nr:hypothetical protein [Devosia sp. YR412]SEQ24586.1 hypothetical protein SAMN05428969_2380 [Devosia sp. YR412]
MKLFGTIAGVLLFLVGLVWILQGANLLAGSAMSGQSQWLYIGIVVAIIGAALVWFVRRR